MRRNFAFCQSISEDWHAWCYFITLCSSLLAATYNLIAVCYQVESCFVSGICVTVAELADAGGAEEGHPGSADNTEGDYHGPRSDAGLRYVSCDI